MRGHLEKARELGTVLPREKTICQNGSEVSHEILAIIVQDSRYDAV